MRRVIRDMTFSIYFQRLSALLNGYLGKLNRAKEIHFSFREDNGESPRKALSVSL